MSIPKYDKKLSYSDYLSWSEDEQIEIIDGIPYNISPAPSTKHQQVSIYFEGLKLGVGEVF